jgi:predicted  nucleic acid-binding Zn-ribbon protein
MMKRIGELKAENARLIALTVEMDKTINASQAECRRLKAEVERLEARIEYVDNLANRYALDDVRSQAHIERLTKAGDAMATGLQGMAGERPKALADEWHDAKEGMQS